LLKIDGARLAVSIPGGSSGEALIIDILGRIIDKKNIPAGGEAIFSIQDFSRILFVQARSQNQLKVFKVLH